MEGTINPNNQDNAARNLESIRCEHRFEMFSKFKEGFGDKFDDLEFMNYTTGEVDVKGATLRDAQTGCEIHEWLGWDSAEHNKTGFHKCGCKQFDEQLQLVSEKNKPLSNIEYHLTLGDGRTVSGKTDNDGKSKRIKSANKALTIEKAEFFVPDKMPRCPQNQRNCSSSEAAKKIDIDEIMTNKENVGSSVKIVTLKIKSRPLTEGEIEMARPIFKNSINYYSIKIHNGEYLPFGFQNDDTAMTPNGGMYFNPDRFVQDFSSEKTGDKIWFMHEMVHIWQHQLGYRVKWNGFWLAISGGYAGGRAYKYDSPENSAKTFPDFNMEQQGDIIAEYFGAKHLNDNRFMPKLPFYEHILIEFIRNPKNVKLLPK